MAPPNRGVSKAVLPQQQSRANPTPAIAARSNQLPTTTTTHINGVPSRAINDDNLRTSRGLTSLTIPYPTASAGSFERPDPRADQTIAASDNLYNIQFSPDIPTQTIAPQSTLYSLEPNSIGISSPFDYGLGPQVGGVTTSTQHSYFPDQHVGSLGPLFQADQTHLGGQQEQNMYSTLSRTNSLSHGMGSLHPMSQHYGPESGFQQTNGHGYFPTVRTSTLGPQTGLPSSETQASQYQYSTDGTIYSAGGVSSHCSSEESMDCDNVFNFNPLQPNLSVSRAQSPQPFDDGLDPDDDADAYMPAPPLGGPGPKSPSPFSPSADDSRPMKMYSGANISSKEKEQNKQKLYRNRKAEFTNKMRDELLAMNMLPHTRITHAPEIMSKTADTLRDYKELLTLIRDSVDGMPENLAQVPGAVKKLLHENGALFAPRAAPAPSRTPKPTTGFKGDYKTMPSHVPTMQSASFRTAGHQSQRSF